MEALAALGRMSVSLVAVLGLLWLGARWLRRSRAVGAATSGLEVLSRVGVGAKAGVAVVRIGERALVVGVTEQQVTLLTEAPAADLLPAPQVEPDQVVEIPAETVAATPAVVPAVATARPAAVATARPTALNGSALSPATWTKAVDVLRERTTRR
ncbi:flagellar biosynthetic protein FliO [Paenibacillus sp. TRM 82003]|uniref:flagellar biosynthetic protein FliO n=1 Tax=Kineococcus sp. TRM81007 TaxID=2925831 RepID=UPI001F56C576|nr:flagellar biosynthetic protein FliO [Kineococcus sp. TRM81007]MCI2240598.1 flagellar biosynthetic protein FliO [Kineococcus sp. TRM81007]MCI3925480.1 flagellar biosynthetic protein FliO [Paenibacillus sp. TRM 82003]